MALSLTIGRHLERAIQAEMVAELELALIERKQSHRFQHKSIICQKGWQCAKVKTREELNLDKPRVKTQGRIQDSEGGGGVRTFRRGGFVQEFQERIQIVAGSWANQQAKKKLQTAVGGGGSDHPKKTPVSAHETISYDFPKLHHSNPNCLVANLHLHPNLKRLRS